MSRNSAPRTGAHVTVPSSGCAGCGHPETLHSNGTTPCRAPGCHSGPGGIPCQGFESRAAGSRAPAPQALGPSRFTGGASHGRRGRLRHASREIAGYEYGFS